MAPESEEYGRSTRLFDSTSAEYHGIVRALSFRRELNTLEGKPPFLFSRTHLNIQLLHVLCRYPIVRLA